MKLLDYVWIVLITGGLIAPAHAAEKSDKAAKRAAIMMQKLKQDLEAEKSNLQAQFEQEKKQLSEQLSKVQSGQRAHDAKLGSQLKRNAGLQAQNQQLTTEKTALTAQLASLQQQFDALTAEQLALKQTLAETQQLLAVNETQRTGLLAKFTDSHQQLQSCKTMNAQLSDYGMSLVNLYADASAYKKAMRSEPFFQLKRVELENILQEKRDLIDQNRVPANP